MATKIISFGFRHGGGPNVIEGVTAIDIRRVFNRNPYHNKKLRPLRGDHPKVIADIQKTPEFEVMFAALKETVALYDGVVWLGCTGGHHRSVYLANRLGAELGVPVEHRDYLKP